MTSVFRRLCRRLDLPEIGVHGLRHTAATAMLGRGAPVHVVARYLGHSSPSITYDVYAHALPRDDRLAVDAIEAALAG